MSFSTRDPSTRASVSVNRTFVARKGLIRRRDKFGYTSTIVLSTSIGERRYYIEARKGLLRHDGNRTKGARLKVPNVPLGSALFQEPFTDNVFC
jgi:hypothetical protein